MISGRARAQSCWKKVAVIPVFQKALSYEGKSLHCPYQTFVLQSMRRWRGAQVAASAVRQEREVSPQRHERVRGGADEGARHRRSPQGYLRLESRQAGVAEESIVFVKERLHIKLFLGGVSYGRVGSRNLRKYMNTMYLT